MRMPASAALFLAGLASGCASAPCDDYAQYMCDCHPSKCEHYQTIYQNADSDLQDECATDLQEQEQKDGATSYDSTGQCGTNTNDSGDTGA